MDKNTIIQNIQSSSISLEQKNELLEMVNNVSEVDGELLSKIIAKLDANSEKAFASISEIGMGAVQEENDKDIQELENQGKDFVKQVNSALDQQDMEGARQTIKES